jgi:superfamily II DNA or RNA helicase
MTTRAAITRAIAEEEARLRRLGAEQSEARARLTALRAGLAALPAPAQTAAPPASAETVTPPVPSAANAPATIAPPAAIAPPAHPAPPTTPSAPAGSSTKPLPVGPRSPAEKLKLFRELFRGRQDVYPTRFVSKKTGRPGYAPACANKFVPGVCDLPKVKCGECTNQAFRPVDDAALVAHLTGKHVMGVYPILADETCWFLAIDFDKSTWTNDVRAVLETCRRLGLPAAVERSRSGNGAHVWFFFSAPVSAAAARKMGCHIITETMASRHELSMDSYDRLFPSQDTLPRGGFGNLIALPLQRGPRQAGNSVFLDEDLVPYPDDRQWAFLASIQRIDPSTVERIAAEATRTGSIVGVRVAGSADDEDATPWTRLPSERRPAPRITEPLPERVSAVLAQRLFVEKSGLPSPLLNQIKRLAAFQNPEFYKKQSMRLSTALTPRVITCAEDLPQHIALPRGCRLELERLLQEHGIGLEVADQRACGDPLQLRFQGTLTATQEEAARALLAHDTGVFVAPPGVGKTVVGIYLVAARACSTMVLVHRRPLLDQWVAQLAVFLGIDPTGIGKIAGGKHAGGKHAPTGRLDVAMVQSLIRRDAVADAVAVYGQVIVDECHHIPAVSFERVLSAVRARYVVGLTATPQRRDGHQPITQMQLGPVRFAVDARTQAGQRPFEHRLVVRETTFRTAPSIEAHGIQGLYAALARDETRNLLILDDVIRALEDGRSPILLTERRDHLEYFAGRLAGVARHLVVLRGGMGAKALGELRGQLAAIPANEERLVLATGRYIGEGFDDARLDTLFLALPVSWKGTLVQYTGRLHRLHPGKREVRIYDYVDREVPMLMRMFEKRLRGYRAIGYARGEAPLAYAAPRDGPVVEYDEEALAALDGQDDLGPG